MYQFELPPELIAQTPPLQRGDSRLLTTEIGKGATGEEHFLDLPSLLREGDRLVLNDTRVLPARLLTRRRDTGGQVELLLLRPSPDAADCGGWLSMARPARRLRPGVELIMERERGPELVLTVGRRTAAGVAGHIVVSCVENLAAVAEATRTMPLPPYIKRVVEDPRDRERYQTVYATADASGAGSVAAPTAGLHFNDQVLSSLEAAGIGLSRVRLHVGPGTFQPPTSEQIAARRLHSEVFHYSAQVSAELAETRARGGRVIAVGTTALRVLESVQRLGLDQEGPAERVFAATASDPQPFFCGRASRGGGYWEVSGETRLFIRPPDRVTAADGLLTNFHLPGSSLLMLVASLLGEDTWRPVYDLAVHKRMRFFSYGDCMLIMPAPQATNPISRREQC